MKRRNFLTATSLLIGSTILNTAKAESKSEAKPLDGHVLLVTGGTSGIGRTTSKELALAGAKVAFCGRRENLGQKAQEEIKKAGGIASYIKCDVREEDQVQKFIEESYKLYGKIDSIFINAGIAQFPNALHKTPADEYKNVFSTNCFGSFNCAKAVIPVFLKQKKGSIIFNTSFGVNLSVPGQAVYAASKTAVEAFMKHIAIDYAPSGIKCYSVQPLSVKTPMIEKRANFLKVAIDEIENPFLKRIIQPEEVANVVKIIFNLYFRVF